MLTKILLALAMLVAGLAYLLHVNTPLSPDMAEPWRIRIFYGLFVFSFIGGPVGEMLGFGTSLNVTRSIEDVVLNIAAPSVDPDLVEREDTVFNGVPVRIYRPKSILQGDSPVPGLVYFHGGGWIMGSIASHDLVTAHYAVEANIIVVSVEYRLSPEYPFPVPVEDCRTAVEYFISNAATFNVDPRRVAVGGDSAGGNLAAAVPLMLRDAKFDPMPKAQVLIYPLLQIFDFNTPSFVGVKKFSPENDFGAMIIRMYLDFPEKYEDAVKNNRHVSPTLRTKYGPYLDPNMIPRDLIPPDYTPTDINNWDKSFPSEIHEKIVHPYVSPALAEDLRGLPEAFVFTAGGDGLRDEGGMFAYRLNKAGVKATWLNIQETFHGCTLVVSGLFGTETGRKANDAIVNFLKKTL